LGFDVDPNATDAAGVTPLHYAIVMDVCQLITNASANLHVRTTEGETPLHICTSDHKVQHLFDCRTAP
jgi:ankyrin repeat protein